jgi:HD-like signal output (HDOD) protein/prolyl-tRNA editing enzyme YbaK/EbsC (Cys-tRNA(Pro) deacylase)
VTLPHCVLNALNSKQVAYQVIEADSADKMAELRSQTGTNEQLALMVVLDTPDSRVQAIVSSNTILNLDALNDHIPERIQSLNPDNKAQLLNGNGLGELPAIPELTNYQTFVDSGLLKAETVLMPSGQQGGLIALSQNDFSTLIEGSQTIKLGISIFDLPSPSSRKQDSDDIYDAIRNYTSLQIKKRLHETLEIPPLSATAQKILNLSADPNADIEDLVQIIELDPSLAAQVVGWAASPYYSAPGKVKSIHDAIVRVLGYELVLNLALGLAMGQSLRVPENGACAISLFWRQAVYCALTMEKLNRITPASKRGQPGFAYLAGLMNNFGYLIFNHAFPSHFSTLCLYMNANPHINPMHIEQHLLGITSEQMCGQLAEAWNLPIQINNALRFKQHPTFDGPDANYANLCFLSIRLLAQMDVGNLPKDTIPESLYQALELDPEKVEEVMQDLAASQDEIEMMLSSLAA